MVGAGVSLAAGCAGGPALAHAALRPLRTHRPLERHSHRRGLALPDGRGARRVPRPHRRLPQALHHVGAPPPPFPPIDEVLVENPAHCDLLRRRALGLPVGSHSQVSASASCSPLSSSSARSEPYEYIMSL